jgi:hypothetical protein
MPSPRIVITVAPWRVKANVDLLKPRQGHVDRPKARAGGRRKQKVGGDVPSTQKARGGKKDSVPRPPGRKPCSESSASYRERWHDFAAN